MNSREFQQSQFFDNILVSSLRFLDALPAKTPNEKSQFMRGLPKILDQFPKSVLDKKVLPALLQETKDKELLSLILQNAFKIIGILPSAQRAMTEKILPQMREIFLTNNVKTGEQQRDPAKEAGVVVVLENMSLIGENCNGKEFKNDVLPIMQLGLESSTHAVVDKALGCLPTVLTVLDFSTIKNEVFPVVAAVFSKTSSLGIKVRGLEAFAILCGGSSAEEVNISDGLDGANVSSKKSQPRNSAVLDKYTIQEKIVPLLKAMKTKEPAVMMAALAVFKQIGRIADAEFLAMEALPILWGFSLGPLLNLQQFQEFMALIKILSARIENEQVRKLRELSSSNSVQDDRRANDLMSVGSANVLSSNGSQDVGENDFERLVLGKGSTNGTNEDMLGGPLKPQAPTQRQADFPTFSWQSNSPSIQNISSTPGILQPQSRTITPDHNLSNFTALNPTASATLRPNNNPITNGMNSLSPMQPSIMQPMQPASGPPSWPPAPKRSSMQQSLPFSLPPPQPQQQPHVVTPFSTFSLLPPPTTLQQRPGVQSQNSGYFTAPNSANNIPNNNQPAQKTGLDKYESLI